MARKPLKNPVELGEILQGSWIRSIKSIKSIKNPKDPKDSKDSSETNRFLFQHQGFLKFTELKERLLRLKQTWPQIVGDVFCAKSIPIRIRGDKLIVGVEASVWTQEMEFSRIKFLDKIRELIPEEKITEIRFQVSSRSS